MKRGEGLFWMASACVLFTASAAMGYLFHEIGMERFQLPQQTVQSAQAELPVSRKIAWWEQHSICREAGLDCAVTSSGQQTEDAALGRLSLEQIVSRYPMPEWTVTEYDGAIRICHNLSGLCPQHRRIYHLGSNENDEYVAVYYGPSVVGRQGGAFLVTDIALANMDPQQRVAMEQGAYEYSSQEELIAMLDNLSEF